MHPDERAAKLDAILWPLPVELRDLAIEQFDANGKVNLYLANRTKMTNVTQPHSHLAVSYFVGRIKRIG
jgi:hypothetical protein